MSDPVVGVTYEDRDRRLKGRLVEVISIDNEGGVWIEVVQHPTLEPWRWRRTRILVEQFARRYRAYEEER